VSRWAGPALASLLALAAVPPVAAQNIAGVLFEDRDADGVRDPGEPGLGGVEVRLFGRTSQGTAVDLGAFTGADGVFLVTPGDGHYLVAPIDPAGWRFAGSRADRFPQTTPGYVAPVGKPRFSKLDRAIANLRAGSYRQSALGDSIAANFNVLCGGQSFWYNKELRSRLAAASGSTVTLDQAAVLGQTTDDLLLDEPDLNNVFRMIDVQPELITLSMIGNDLLDVDPGDGGTQADANRAVAEVLDARQNLQEVLSAFASEIQGADVVLNTLYDNEAHDCTPSNFHKTWVPIVARILRDVAWGQSRRVSIAEVAAEFAQRDQAQQCTGFQGMICTFFLDQIHPTQAGGYPIVAEKLWEASGGVTLGVQDVLDRTSLFGVDHGYLRHVRRLSPLAWEISHGATASAPAAALSDQDGATPAAIALGNGTEEFRVAGFPDWYDEVVIVRVIAGVRYRTSGAVDDDLYRMEASVTGQFRPPPGFSYTPTSWNFYTPIVGGGGPLRPVENPDYPAARTLVLPEVADYREVTATLTKNPTLPPGSADYLWPAVTHEELATTAIRVAAAPDPGAAGDDDYQVELDHAWLDLYGWEKPRPPEVAGLRVERLADGALQLSFDTLASAQRYNLYAGRLSTAASGSYDHGAGAPAGPLCDATTQAAGAGRLAIGLAAGSQPAEDAYFLLTAHVDGVESPAGQTSGGSEIDRAQSICK